MRLAISDKRIGNSDKRLATRKNESNRQSPVANRLEEGVTLVVSVVLLASITAISFSISTIIIRELGSAQLLLRTEPAISGANSGGEIGLYRLIRELGQTSTQGTTPESGASFTIRPDLYDDPYNFTVASGGKIRVGLYDAEKTGKTTSNYQSFSLTNTGNSAMRVVVYSWADTKTAFCGQQTINKNNQYNCTLNAVDDRYIIEIEPVGNNTVSGQILAVRADGSRGVPADSPAIDVVGQSGNVQRRLEINLQ